MKRLIRHFLPLFLLILMSLYSGTLSSVSTLPKPLLEAGLLIMGIFYGCLRYKNAVAGLGLGTLSGFAMFPLAQLLSFLSDASLTDYPSLIINQIPLSLIFSFGGLFILFELLKSCGALEALVRWITLRLVVGPKSAKVTTFLLGMIFYVGGTPSSASVSTVMRPIALRYISPEELSALVDMTSSPVALIFQRFSYWGIFLAPLLVSESIPFLSTLEQSSSFLNTLVWSPWLAANYLMLGIALLLSLDAFPHFLLSKRFKLAIKTKKLYINKETTLEEQESNAPYVIPPAQQSMQAVQASIALLCIGSLFIGSAFLGFQMALLLSFGLGLVSSMALLLVQKESSKQAITAVVEALENGLKESVPVLLILFFASFVGLFLKVSGFPEYMVDTLHSVPLMLAPLLMGSFTFIIAYASGTSFGTYKIMLPLAAPVVASLALSAGLDTAQTGVLVQAVISTILVTSVQADQCSLISDTTIVSAQGSGCDVMSHFLTQLPIVFGVFIFTLIYNTILLAVML